MLRPRAAELSGREIAGRLFVSVKPLRTYTKHTVRKLDGEPYLSTAGSSATCRCGRASISGGRCAWAAFSYEMPAKLTAQAGDLFMPARLPALRGDGGSRRWLHRRAVRPGD